MSAAATPDVGELYPLRNSFYADAAHLLLDDPTTVTLTITDPAGADFVVAPPTRESQGVYTYPWVPALGGLHYGRWVGTGTIEQVDTFAVLVRGATSEPASVYATIFDVKALAGGFLAGAWGETTDVNEQSIATFLAFTSGEIDGIIASRGAVLPLLASDPVAVALRSLTADGALIRALDATWPSDAPEGVVELRNDARARYSAGLAALASGTHAAALALASTNAATSASTLELDDPTYGRWTWDGTSGGHWDEADWNPGMAPGTRRGQQL